MKRPRRALLAAAALVAAGIGLVPVPASAASVRIQSVTARRIADVCVGAVGCVGGIPKAPDVGVQSGQPSCLAAVAVQPAPTGQCRVLVVASAFGVVAPRTAVQATLTLRHATGAPWAQPLRSSAEIEDPTEPVQDEVCAQELPTNAIGCAASGASAWTSTAKLRSSRSGSYAVRFERSFAAAGFDGVCERVGVRIDVRAGSQRASHDLGTIQLCA